jgi:hypothetical protein
VTKDLKVLNLTAADFELVDDDHEYVGEVDLTDFDGSIEIAADLGLVRFPKHLRATGYIRAGAGTGIAARRGIMADKDITAGNDIWAAWGIWAGKDLTAGNDIWAGESITAGWGVSAGNGIWAAWGVSAGRGITAGKDITAGWGVSAGNGIWAGWGVSAGRGITAGKDILAGQSITAGKDILAGQSITAGKDILAGWGIWAGGSVRCKGVLKFGTLVGIKEPTAANILVECGRIEGGEIVHGHRVELQITSDVAPPPRLVLDGAPMTEAMSTLERRAWFVYEAARLHALAVNAPVIPEPWEDRDDPFKVQFLEVIARQMGPMRSGSPAELHGGWVQAYIDMGWRYGPVRDSEVKTHPDMVPYDQLEQREQDKDSVFIALCEIARQWIKGESVKEDATSGEQEQIGMDIEAGEST